ncbi:hypothetical protein RHSIM_Rhsim06G0007300 [Rhododendron simsii]|uniref:Uncharacterized protein n=1 Tax=Rhododendron simsii TaxID=118357 RepID=A0A834GT91_RHOSS|nr:hypothetical protein RHSIM_Rhsim06G0007300 [Rhododendron simsii]
MRALKDLEEIFNVDPNSQNLRWTSIVSAVDIESQRVLYGVVEDFQQVAAYAFVGDVGRFANLSRLRIGDYSVKFVDKHRDIAFGDEDDARIIPYVHLFESRQRMGCSTD